MYDTIIIGSGYGGLSSAALLAKNGKKVLLLERSSCPGGRSFYTENNGYTWIYGPHSLRFASDGIASEVFKKLNEPLEFITVKNEKAMIYYKGSLYKRPEGLSGFLTTRALSLKGRIIFIKFFMRIMKERPENWYSCSLRSFYRTFFSNKEVEDFISYLGYPVMVTDIDIVSAGEVIDFVHRMKKAKVKVGELKGGTKQIIIKLQETIKQFGGEIRFKEPVKSIVIKNGTAVGVKTEKVVYNAKNIIYAAPLNNLFSLANKDLFKQSFIEYCDSIKFSSGFNIDFISRKPLGDYTGGILGIESPYLFLIKFPTLIDDTLAPAGIHICTAEIQIEPGKSGDKKIIADAEKKLKNYLDKIIPGYMKKVIEERKTIMPVINGVMLTPGQSKPERPAVYSADIKNLFFAGDTVAGDGCSGDIAFSSALKIAALIG